MSRFLVCRVPNRVCLRLKGSAEGELSAYLQGLTTNNVKGFMSQPKSAGSMFAGLLSPQGRILFDTIIHKVPSNGRTAGSEELLMECDDRCVDLLVSHLDKYRLRSKVNWHVDHDMDIWSIHSPSGSVFSNGRKDHLLPLLVNVADGGAGGVLKMFDGLHSWSVDPRHMSMGVRVIAGAFASPSGWKDTVVDDDSGRLASFDAYTMHRYLLGISEGAVDMPPDSRLPQEFNLDIMNGIDYRKGCYIGQELVVRTHHRGVVRKRVVPIALKGMVRHTYDEVEGKDGATAPKVLGDNSLAGKKLYLSSSPSLDAEKKVREDGRIISHSNGLGLALVRLDKFDGSLGKLEYRLGNDLDHDLLIEASWPKWWPLNHALPEKAVK